MISQEEFDELNESWSIEEWIESYSTLENVRKYYDEDCLSFEEWREKYQPIFSFDDDWDLLRNSHTNREENKVWTILETDGLYSIVTGRKGVNAIGNVVTRIPFELASDDFDDLIWVFVTEEEYEKYF